MSENLFFLANLNEVSNQINRSVSDAMEDVVKRFGHSNPKAIVNSKKGVYMTRQEVCEMLHISLPTLHRMVNRGIIICYKSGRRSLFKVSEVEASLVKLNVSEDYCHVR